MSFPVNDLGLSDVVQVGFVFPKIAPVLPNFEALFGKFTVLPSQTLTGAAFRGRVGDYQIGIAIGYSGKLEIELIEWISGETPHREFLEKGRSGMHHLSFRVENTEDVIERAKKRGYEPIWYHRMTPEIAYAYLERPGDPLILELSERPWDGGNVSLDGWITQ
jgi:hypothetical protein